MGLSGSDQAYKQARFGIMRFGASRFGYYTPNVVVTINGTDRTAYIQPGSLSVTLNLNDEPDTASFTVVPGLTVTTGHRVVVALGAATNPIFSGVLVRKRHQWVKGSVPPSFVCEAQDVSYFFNRRLATARYQSMSATDIAADIVSRFTSGFTWTGVKASMATIDEFVVTNELPAAALRRLAAEVGGGFYLQPVSSGSTYADVHLFDSSGETGWRARSAPATLTSSLQTLKSWAHEYDASQVRTRVIVEGARATLPIEIPAGTEFPVNYTGPGQINYLPVVNADRIANATNVRIGPVTTTTTVSVADGSVAPALIATLSTDAVKGDTSITVSSTSGLPTRGWVKIGEEFLYYDTVGGPTTLATIPATGFGSLRTGVEAGVQVTPLSVLSVTGGTVFESAVESGSEIVLRVSVDDAAAQSALAAIEGGDGIHELSIQDGRLSFAGATDRATNHLALFGAMLVDARWDTEDMNAWPGARQVVSLSGVDTLSATLTITRVTVTFPVQGRRPLRAVEGSTTRVADLVSTLVSVVATAQPKA